MMIGVSFDAEQWARDVNRSVFLARMATQQAVNAEAITIANKADELVPFDDGDLSASQQIEFATAGIFTAIITYGGLAAPYALVQHENMNYKHGLGRSAKYLERPAEEAKRGFAARIMARIKAAT